MEELIIKSLPENVAQVEQFVEKIQERYNIDPEVFGNLLISVTEAANNAIIHGNKCDSNKDVQLTANLDESGKRLIFIVKDAGLGFDFNGVADPTSPENIDKTCGRGVFLMKQLSDLIIFSDKGSKVEMQFKL